MVAFLAEEMNSDVANAAQDRWNAKMQMIVLSVIASLLAVITGLFITRTITRPIKHAVYLAEAVAQGNLMHRLEVYSKDEIGRLLRALQNMIENLHGIVGRVREGTDAINSLIRIERLYPFPAIEQAAELAKFSNLKELVWAQEEDKNQGAWQFFREQHEDVLPAGVSLRCTCRKVTAAGARASTRQHLADQLLLVAAALS